jgi:hypothetical protein
MKKIKFLSALLIFFLTPLTSSAAIVYSGCYFSEIDYTDVCSSSVETLNYDLSGTSDFYNFDPSAGQGQDANPYSTYSTTGSLEFITTVSNLDTYSPTTTITGAFTVGLIDKPGLSYSAQFNFDSYSGLLQLTSEGISGISWTITTPTLWEFFQTESGISLNTIVNSSQGNYPGFNPLNGILTGDTGNTVVDLTLTGTISAVPVPAAVWLFASGIIGLVGFVKRKKN